MCFVFPSLLEVRTEPCQLQRHAGRIIMTFSYGETKNFFLNDSLFGILKGAEVGGRGGGVGIVVAGTGFAEM